MPMYDVHVKINDVTDYVFEEIEARNSYRARLDVEAMLKDADANGCVVSVTVHRYRGLPMTMSDLDMVL